MATPEQVQAMAQALKANPNALAKLEAMLGQTKTAAPAFPTTPSGIAEEAGIGGAVPKTTIAQLTKAAIDRTAPEFKQSQAEREASLLRFPGLQTGGGRAGDQTGVDFVEGEGFVAGKDFAEVPVGRTEEGGIQSKFEKTPEALLREKVAEMIATGKAESGKKMAEGQRASERSLSVVSTTLNDFSKVLVGAFDEGGFGDVIKATKTALKQKFAGGLATKELIETGKIPGKKVEIITKMMPLLTQQGDKPGSVRLVSTVFERLADSLPGANLRGDVKGNDMSLEEARGMMSSTILSMLRFSQAIQSLGITNADVDKIPGKITQNPDGSMSVEKGSELSKFGDLIERVSQQFFTEGSEEEQQIQDFIGTALKPLDDKILLERQKEEGGLEAGTLSQADEERLLEIDRQIAEARGQ